MRKLMIALPMLLLCACSVGPDYVRPATPVHDHWNLEYQAAENLANAQWWRPGAGQPY
jgi:multidrug efflux system outer membrane protein